MFCPLWKKSFLLDKKLICINWACHKMKRRIQTQIPLHTFTSFWKNWHNFSKILNLFQLKKIVQFKKTTHIDVNKINKHNKQLALKSTKCNTQIWCKIMVFLIMFWHWIEECLYIHVHNQVEEEEEKELLVQNSWSKNFEFLHCFYHFGKTSP